MYTRTFAPLSSFAASAESGMYALGPELSFTRITAEPAILPIGESASVLMDCGSETSARLAGTVPPIASTAS